MIDPLTDHTHAEVLEDLVAAVGAIIDTFSAHRIPATRDDPADYILTHEAWAAEDLRNALAAARAVLNAENAA